MRFKLSLFLLVFFVGLFKVQACEEAKNEVITFELWVTLMKAGYARALEYGNDKNPSHSDLCGTIRELANMKKIKDRLIESGKNREEDFSSAFTNIFKEQEKRKYKSKKINV